MTTIQINESWCSFTFIILLFQTNSIIIILYCIAQLQAELTTSLSHACASRYPPAKGSVKLARPTVSIFAPPTKPLLASLFAADTDFD